MSDASAFEACTQLTHRFFHCLDEQRYDDMLAMMRPDAVWLRQGKRLAGHAQIRAALDERSPSQRIRHVVTNGFVEREDAGGVDFNAYMLGYRYDDGTPRQPPLTIAGPVRMLLIRTRFVREAAGEPGSLRPDGLRYSPWERPGGSWRIQEMSAIPEFEFATPKAA